MLGDKGTGLNVMAFAKAEPQHLVALCVCVVPLGICEARPAPEALLIPWPGMDEAWWAVEQQQGCRAVDV